MEVTEKICFKCLCKKPLEAFYKHSRMRGGHLNKCIECTKRDVREHRQANIERIKVYDKLRGSMPHRVAARKEYAKTPEGKAAIVRAHKASNERFPNKHRARNILHAAVRDGKIEKWPCQMCGCEKSEAHHPDYDSPLAVVWLCNEHHRAAHKLAKEAA